MIDIEQCPLGPLEQHRLAALQRIPDDSPRIHGQRQQARCQALEEMDVLLRTRPLRVL